MKASSGRAIFRDVLITGLFFVFGGLWALFSDRLFSLLLYQTGHHQFSIVYSHWFFVVLSALGLFLLLRSWDRRELRSEESLNIIHRSFRSFSACVETITRADEENRLLEDICRICVETGGHRLAWVAYAEDDENKTLRTVTHWGEKSCFIECIHATWKNSQRGQGPSGTCVRTGETVVFQDLTRNRRYKPWREAALKCHFSSCIALPLKNRQKTFGTLVIFNERINAFDKGEIRLLSELAKDLSYGIENLRLREKQEREVNERLMLATATDQTSDGVITFDVEGTIQYMNPRFVQLCGIPADQGVGVSIHDFACSHSNRVFYQAVLDVFATNKSRKGQFVNRKSDGTEYEIDARISPVFNSAGVVVRYVATVRDITQEIKLQRQLGVAQKMEAVAALSGGIANDFKTILGKIMLNSESAFEGGTFNEQQQAVMLSIYKEALRAKGLVQQFMAISRQTEQPKEQIKINEVVTDSIKIIQSTLPSTIELKTQVDPDCGLVKGIPSQIQQAIINICTNSQDTMRGIGNIIEINLSTTEIPLERQRLNPEIVPGHYAVLTITDSGEGFTRDESERIFEPFYSLKGEGERGGLGLSVAHGIIKNHGGHISVNSIKGVGTTFVVLLPQVDSDGQRLNQVADGAAEKRILYVGAEEDNFSAIRSALKDIGYRVNAELEGRRALQQFQQHHQDYDLVIADQGLVDMSGEIFIKEALSIRPEIPIILCSEPERVAGLENDSLYQKGNVLLKPYQAGEMCQTVQHVLKK